MSNLLACVIVLDALDQRSCMTLQRGRLLCNKSVQMALACCLLQDLQVCVCVCEREGWVQLESEPGARSCRIIRNSLGRCAHCSVQHLHSIAACEGTE